ncbi:MAG: phosphoribosylformylglycinamidine cyclo-ligase [Dehalococcoidales bacterium]
MEQIFAGLWGSFGTVGNKYQKYMKGMIQDYFSFEIVGANGTIHFYVRVIRKYRDLIEAQIYSQYPQAEIKEVEDYAKSIPLDMPNKNWDLWGTKLKLAVTLDSYDSVGMDIVNHSVNDILTCGAAPLFFLDYIAMSRLMPEKVKAVVKGLSMACQQVGCALIGGETAEMPGLYSSEDFDLVGTIIGAVEKDRIIDGRNIVPGDIMLGLASSGLHTNGYSLARKVLGESKHALDTFYLELGQTLGQAMLVPHRCYFKEIQPLLPRIKGLAHITGGGFPGNMPRIMPEGVTARFDTSSWAVPPIFKLIQQKGSIKRDEMYRVFNMGIGMVIIASADNTKGIVQELPESKIIGKITRMDGCSRVVLD